MSIAFLKVSLLFDLYEIKTIKYMENISNFAVGFISTIALFFVLQSAQADIANRNATPKEISKIVEVLKQDKVGSTKALTVAYLIPVFAVIWGGLILHEPVTSSIIFGCGLILFGTAIA